MSKKKGVLKGFLAVGLVAMIGVATVAMLSKGFTDWNIDDNWNEIVDKLTPETIPEDVFEEDEIYINFANAYGITTSEAPQEFTNKKADGKAGNKYLGFTNAGKRDWLNQNKLVVGQKDSYNDEKEEFYFSTDYENTSVLNGLSDLFSDVQSSNTMIDEETPSEYVNYVYLHLFEEGLTGESINLIESATWEVTYTGTSDEFAFIFGVNGAFDAYPSLFGETIIEETSFKGKTRATISLDLDQGFVDDGFASAFYLAIYGASIDSTVTVESFHMTFSEDVIDPDTQYPLTNTITSHPDYTYVELPEEPEEEVDGVNVVSQSRMDIKKTSTGQTEQGRPYVQMTYSLLPSNTTDTSIQASVSWVDSSVQLTASEYLSANLDTVNKTLTVTCLQDFSHQMKVRLVSIANSNINATITFDLGQKFLGFDDTVQESISYIEVAPGVNYSNYYPDLVSGFTNGYSTVFTVATSTAPVFSSIEVDNIFIGYATSQDGLTMTNGSIPSSGSSVVSLVDTALASIPINLDGQDFIDAFQNDIDNLWSSSLRSDFYNAGTRMIGVNVATTIKANIAGSGVSSYRVNFTILCDSRDLDFSIPLNAINPEIPGYVF